jgi:hypothetical protein
MLFLKVPAGYGYFLVLFILGFYFLSLRFRLKVRIRRYLLQIQTHTFKSFNESKVNKILGVFAWHGLKVGEVRAKQGVLLNLLDFVGSLPLLCFSLAHRGLYKIITILNLNIYNI